MNLVHGNTDNIRKSSEFTDQLELIKHINLDTKLNKALLSIVLLFVVVVVSVLLLRVLFMENPKIRELTNLNSPETFEVLLKSVPEELLVTYVF